MAPGDLTDEEWTLIEPHLPLGERGPIPDLRQQFNAVMWRFWTGSPWRDLPAEYGPWSTTYDRFRSWAMADVFARLMQAMIAEAAARGQVDLDLVSVDSTTVRAHHHAAGMVLDQELVTALDKAIEQERGLRQRGKTVIATGSTPAPTPTTELDASTCDNGARSGCPDERPDQEPRGQQPRWRDRRATAGAAGGGLTSGGGQRQRHGVAPIGALDVRSRPRRVP
ncbi:transposase [Nonomuraea sp. NPDC049152]|uniref:transposase n=1 Tax=Nonomuraea sp. NPDC049152 TaxID=3154350 RepID=UPI0033EF7F9D